MQDEIVIYYYTHKWKRIHERVQPYVFETGFLYVSCLDHIKLDLGLIYALNKRWICKTHTFHLRHREMILTIQNISILLELPIDRLVVTSIGICN
jgi:hypothetical protein